jgi:hypothetical protein
LKCQMLRCPVPVRQEGEESLSILSHLEIDPEADLASGGECLASPEPVTIRVISANSSCNVRAYHKDRVIHHELMPIDEEENVCGQILGQHRRRRRQGPGRHGTSPPGHAKGANRKVPRKFGLAQVPHVVA